jgi:hypothetical protein
MNYSKLLWNTAKKETCLTTSKRKINSLVYNKY